MEGEIIFLDTQNLTMSILSHTAVKEMIKQVIKPKENDTK